MAKKHRPILPTPAELRILQLLWSNGEASVEAVVSAHPPKHRPNYKTTQTILRIMEQKGFVSHETRGRVFVYRHLISRENVDRLSVSVLLHQNFRGSRSGLLLNLLEEGPIEQLELAKMEAMIRECRRRNENGPPEKGV